MPTQTLYIKALLPLSLVLGLTVTACGENTSSNTSDIEIDTPQTTVDSSETTPIADNTADSTPEEVTNNLTSLELSLAGDGLQIVDTQSGDVRIITFETDIETAQTAISTVLGEPTDISENGECGAGPMGFITWSNGFTMNALAEQFVGWTVREGTESENLTTADGVGLGKTLADLEANYTVEVIESSLGTEFSASDSLFGLLSANEPTGVITYLWSGIACNFR